MLIQMPRLLPFVAARRRFLGLLFVLPAAVLPPIAYAEVSFLSQQRQVSTFATIDFVEGTDLFSSDVFESQETGQFDETANCQLEEAENQATSTASQLSYVIPQFLLAEGSIAAQAEISEEAQFAEAFGGSRYVSTFFVDVVTEVQLDASLWAGGNGSTNLVFRVAQGEILVHRSIHDDSETIDEAYSLAPGAYELTLTTGGYGQAFPGGGNPASGSFSASIIFPQAADVPFVASTAEVGPIVAPNPLRGQARIIPSRQPTLEAGASSANGSNQEIIVLDPAGRIVRRFAAVGETGVVWDARDDFGHRVAAGMYLISQGSGAWTRAVVLR